MNKIHKTIIIRIILNRYRIRYKDLNNPSNMDTLTSNMLRELIYSFLAESIEFTYDPRDRLTRDEIVGRIIDHLKSQQITAAFPKRLSFLVNLYVTRQKNAVLGFYTRVKCTQSGKYVKKFAYAGIRWKPKEG